MPFYGSLKSNSPIDRRTALGLLRLKEGFVSEKLPQRNLDTTLVLATWNLREFGGNKSGGRENEPLFYIAEIINRFDLVAVQEVRDDLSDLNELMRILGAWWKVIYTDVTQGRQGNEERTAFIYDSRKLSFGGLAGEVVLPPTLRGAETVPAEQVARSPFIVGFRAGWFRFTICTAHLFYGEAKPDDPRRLREMKLLAAFLHDRVKEKTAWARNMILLGDFNIFTFQDQTFQALTENGFQIPKAVETLTANLGRNKHYDQIAFIAPTVEDQLKEAASGGFPFDRFVYRDEDEALYAAQFGTGKYKTWRTYKMSDHLPLWVELRTDFGKEYLTRKSQETP